MCYLTGLAIVATRCSNFGVSENNVNSNVVVLLESDQQRIGFCIDATDYTNYEWHTVSDLSKESLTAKPAKLYIMLHGTMKYVRVGYNLTE